jgi:hypothetical protein
MSTQLRQIGDITITQFYGGRLRGTCVQLKGPDGYVQLDARGVGYLVEVLHDFLFGEPILESEEKI